MQQIMQEKHIIIACRTVTQRIQRCLQALNRTTWVIHGDRAHSGEHYIRGFIYKREADHYIIFTNRSSRMYCCHTKENTIQLHEYKDCNGGPQPLRHAKNGHSAYTIQCRWRICHTLSDMTGGKIRSSAPSSQINMMLYQKALTAVFVGVVFQQLMCRFIGHCLQT